MEKILNSAAMKGLAGNHCSKTVNYYCFSKPILLQKASLDWHSVKNSTVTKNVTTYPFWNQDRNTAYNKNSCVQLVYHKTLSIIDAIGYREESPMSVEQDSNVYLN